MTVGGRHARSAHSDKMLGVLRLCSYLSLASRLTDTPRTRMDDALRPPSTLIIQREPTRRRSGAGTWGKLRRGFEGLRRG